jgi:hypothetical protein
MIISSVQQCFIPWLGYFEQIAVADAFVYLDDAQYTKKDWRNTNRLKSPYGVKTVYVPVRKTTRETRLNQALISSNELWEAALLNQVTAWYRKAPFFSEILAMLERPLSKKYERLVDLDVDLNNEVLAYLGITTPIHLASEIPKTSVDRNARIVEICRHFPEADVLYDGKSAQTFIDLDLFRRHGIDVVFQNYQQTPYPQLWGGPFEPSLSIIDLLMNCGPASRQVLLSSPLPDSLRERR